MQFTWDPYVPQLVNAMPPYLLEHYLQWRASTYMICFDIVELHLPDRVMRQFGFRQFVPAECDTNVRLHNTDRRGKSDISWMTHHGQYIELWGNRLQHIIDGHPMEGHMDYTDPYMVWYRLITRLYINPTYTPPSTHYQPAFDSITGYVSPTQ